jgi:amino acid permease
MSLSGLIGITVFMLTFILYYFICIISDDFGDKPKGGMNAFPSDWFSAAAAVPNIFFAITFQNNFFPLFKGLKGPSDKKMAQVSIMGVGFCATSYILVGLMGYHYIGPGVSANFLTSFHYATFSKPFYFLLNTSFLISIFCAFPIMFFGCRNNFIALIQLFMNKRNKKWRSD